MPARARLITARFAVVTLLTAMLAMLAGPALAHDQLVSSSPADGETLTAAPPSLTLSYSAEIATIGIEVQVTAPDGTSAVAGDPTVSGTDVVVPLRADLPAGGYQVVWRVTSSDGHPIDGTLAFTLDLPASSAPAESATATATAITTEPTTAEPTTAAREANSPTPISVEIPGGPPDLGLPNWVIGVIALGIVGSIVAILLRLRRSSRLRE